MQNQNGCCHAETFISNANGRYLTGRGGSRSAPTIYRGQAHRLRQSAVNSLNSEAVVLAPPPTHAVHEFHIFFLNTLRIVILPDCVLIYQAESRLLFFVCLCSY